MTKSLFLSLSLLAFLCLISCNKEKTSYNKTTTTPNMKKQVIVNGFNFDQFGISHNNYLDYVQQDPNFQTATSQQLFNYGATYNDTYFGSWASSGETYSYLQGAVTYSTGLVTDIINGQNVSPQLITDSLADSISAPYWDTLASIFHDALDTPDHGFYTPEEFIQKIQNLENQITSNLTVSIDPATMTGNDGAELLGACSIAKYSYSYWYNIATNPNPPTTGWSSPQCSFIRNVWHAITVAATDTWAFVGDGNAYPKFDKNWNVNGIGVKWDLDQAVDDAGDASSHVAANKAN
ncbi:MAG TPA: hypothetical protein VN721_13565 [Flavipsychrobacter sp.]|nr:hypothetical protein [Flavipsychrobacter sp.]